MLSQAVLILKILDVLLPIRLILTAWFIERENDNTLLFIEIRKNLNGILMGNSVHNSHRVDTSALFIYKKRTLYKTL